MRMKKEKLSVLGLAAIVLSAMIGGGVYDLPKDMAENANGLGQILAWLITGVGMWFITNMFMQLSQLKPKLTTGLYKYGEQGFGKFTGFFIAWGYWICECFTNCAYAILLMSTLNFFFPGKFTGGNNWLSIVIASIFLWLMSFIIISGIRNANSVEIIATIGTFVAVIIFIISMVVHFHWSIFTQNVSLINISNASQHYGSLFNQISKSLMVTLWVFGGIEGAVVLSDRAKSQNDVRKATFVGFIICLLIYTCISLVPLGIFSAHHVSQLVSPSMASLLSLVWHSEWGKIIISAALLITVFSGWLTWTLILAEMPYAAAKDGAFPKIFAKENKRKIPVVSLIGATVVIQIILIFAHFSQNAFETMYTCVGTLTVPPYLICALYLIKLSFIPSNKINVKACLVGFIAAIYTIIMGYSAGINYLTIAFIVYLIGLPVYMWNQFEKQVRPWFTKNELIFVVVIILIALVGIYSITSVI